MVDVLIDGDDGWWLECSKSITRENRERFSCCQERHYQPVFQRTSTPRQQLSKLALKLGYIEAYNKRLLQHGLLVDMRFIQFFLKDYHSLT